MQPACILELNAPGSAEATIFNSQIVSSDRLAIVYGSQFRPTFEVADFKVAGEVLPSLVLTRVLDDEPVAVKSKKTTTAKLINSEPTFKPETEMTMEEKVKKLEVGDGKTQSKAMTSTSLHRILSQALASSDVELFEKSIAVTDAKIINATVSKLSTPQILPLLDALTTRLVKKPARANLLVVWIKAALLHHQSYLLSVPSTNSRSRTSRNVWLCCTRPSPNARKR
jgi:Dip2/Utp12 Family